MYLLTSGIFSIREQRSREFVMQIRFVRRVALALTVLIAVGLFSWMRRAET